MVPRGCSPLAGSRRLPTRTAMAFWTHNGLLDAQRPADGSQRLCGPERRKGVEQNTRPKLPTTHAGLAGHQISRMTAYFITPEAHPLPLGLSCPSSPCSAIGLWPALEGSGPTCPSDPPTLQPGQLRRSGGMGRMGLGAEQVSCALTLRAGQTML